MEDLTKTHGCEDYKPLEISSVLGMYGSNGEIDQSSTGVKRIDADLDRAKWIGRYLGMFSRIHPSQSVAAVTFFSPA